MWCTKKWFISFLLAFFCRHTRDFNRGLYSTDRESMTDNQSLPHLDSCLELCQIIHNKHGTKPFETEDIEWDSSELTSAEILNFGVAYGILSLNDGKYHLNCSVDAPENRWATALHNHADEVQQAIINQLDLHETANHENDSLTTLRWGDEVFISVFVDETDDFDSVVDSVATVDLSDRDGVVLRSPGDYANEVQRFADQLCNIPERSDNLIVTTFDKISSDVTGSEKNSLEFRIYLRAD